MIFLPEILILCFVVFLYCVFAFAREDFILLRKNISLEHMFSMSFLTFFVGLLFARVFFVLGNFSTHYLNLLVFLVFIYFPGLSFAGAILGGLVFLSLILKRRKMPFGRVFDIFSLSFIFSVYVGNLAVFIIDLFSKKIEFMSAGLSILFLLGFILFAYLFANLKFRKDGSCGYSIISFFSLVHLINLIFQKGRAHLLTISFEEVLLLVIFLTMLGFFLKQEFFYSKKK